MAIAFFDIDHTIISSISAEKLFFFYLLKRKKIPLNNFLKFFIFFIKNIFTDPYRATLQNKQYLANQNIKQTILDAQVCFNKKIKPIISFEALNKINWHKKRGDKIVLLSGNLFFLADLLKQYVQANDSLSTQLVVVNNVIQGNIIGLHPYGEAKRIILNEYIKTHHLEKEKIYCYANSYHDIPFLECADYPFAVNASQKLKKYAKQNNWPLVSFPQPKKKIHQERKNNNWDN